jgi:O-antigen/teichoic acid export membrane protein
MSDPTDDDLTESWGESQDAPTPGGLQRHVVRGLAWTLIGTWGRQGLDLLVFIVLARLLAPAEIGLVALATVFVLFAQLIVDQGLGDALVQRRDITRSHIDTAFWAAMATGLLLTIAMLLGAGPISVILKEPGLQPILQVLSVTFILTAVTSIQIALLRRALAFRSVALRAIAASAGGGVVGVVMAFWGAGAWALVGQQVASSVFSVLTLWWVTNWRPSFHASRSDFRELFGFGIHIVGSDVLTFLTRNLDSLLIGAVLGPLALGFYTVGFRILSASQTVLVQITRKMTFPVFSRLQHDRDRMRRAYFRVTRASALAIVPGYVGLSLVATELTIVLFGGRWQQSGLVATILLLTGPVVSIQAFSIALLNAVGRPDVAFRFRLLTTLTSVVGFAVAVPFGIVAVAVAYVVRGYVLLPLNLRWMAQYADIPTGEYLRQMRGVAAATATMAAAMLGSKWLLLSGFGPATLLGSELLLGGLVFFASLWLVDRPLIRDVVQVAVEAVPMRRPRPTTAADDG